MKASKKEFVDRIQIMRSMLSLFGTFLKHGHVYHIICTANYCAIQTFSICSLLYQSPAENSHLVYMALIVLLILTENEDFAKDVHDIVSRKPGVGDDGGFLISNKFYYV